MKDKLIPLERAVRDHIADGSSVVLGACLEPMIPFAFTREIIRQGKRDLEVKPKDYARTGIAEYWIADPELDTLTVLRLAEGRYVEHGVYRPGETFQSPSLDGLKVDVVDLFAR